MALIHPQSLTELTFSRLPGDHHGDDLDHHAQHHARSRRDETAWQT